MEQWKKYGRYEISNYGRVKSVDTERPKLIKLHCDKKGYLRCGFYENGKNKTIRVHVLVWDLFGDSKRDGLYVDHIDEDKKNNHINNLQLLTNRENCIKGKSKYKYTSSYAGVSLNRRDNIWVARIGLNGVYKHLGSFKDEHEAHLAYQQALSAFEYGVD